MNGAQLPASACPACGKVMDAAGDPFDDSRQPLPGDYSFCVYCGELLKFAADMQLLAVSEEEVRSLAPDHQAFLASIQLTLLLTIAERDLQKRSAN